MKQTSVDYSKAALLILIGFPVCTALTILTDRILLEPYPRNAWGSWLLVGWAIAVLLTLIQFVLGTIVHADDLGRSFLLFGIPTLLYAFVLLSLTNSLFPTLPGNIPAGFLLTEFQENFRGLYGHAFVLALLPFVMGFAVFGDRLASFPQITRIVWMGTFAVGIALPPTNMIAHTAVWFIAFPLMLILLRLYSKLAPGTAAGREARDEAPNQATPPGG